MAEDSVFEVVEADYDHCNIVQRSAEKRVFEDILYAHSAHFVDVTHVILNCRVSPVVINPSPNTRNRILVGHLVKDSITPKNDKVVFSLNLERLDLWVVNHDIRISIECLDLGLRVPKCSCN